jgi:toxin ParE1/3/4
VTKPRRLVISPRAAADLDELAAYIARDNPDRAASFVAELEAECRAAASNPKIYPLRSDLAAGLRMLVHRPYLVFFRDLEGQDTVRIERILHGARNLPRWLRQK